MSTSWLSKDNGITALNPPKGTDVSLVVIFLTLALYNVAELAFIIPSTFKRWSGFYFWCFVMATWSIVPYSVGFILKGLAIVPQAIYFWVTCGYIGWVGMVLFQSLVLWSRLHLIVDCPRRLRAILYMIIFNTIICDVPVAVLAFGSNSPHPEPYAPIYAIWESIHVTVFALQEVIISVVYVWETSKLLRIERDSGATFDLPARRKVLTHLIYVSIIVVILDLPTLAMQYTEMYSLQTAYKGFVYSVKLKLEFSILNKLIDISRGRPVSRPTSLPVYSGNRPVVGVATATVTSSSGPTTPKPQGEPSIRRPSTIHSSRCPGLLRWMSRQYGRDAELDTCQTGRSNVLPVEVEGGAKEAVRVIQVAVETQITIESQDAREVTTVSEKEKMDAGVEEKLIGGIVSKAKGKTRYSSDDKNWPGPAYSGGMPPNPSSSPHPSESLALPEMLVEEVATTAPRHGVAQPGAGTGSATPRRNPATT
ncbi:hypothetical protein MAPG_01337 [Magnaporthiopsis poae ATCC 64411]|uniref:DUF7703 domain-containing protein n=1 Tax=Magnaporthiopsis poae (strain ATCC 64411 / 73-15) TaxID=644358 RepID=A0A0C4DNF6_MAGP6|nr:hypothetical protein MAPG_01337 [Magnaporthiopsis poae ATCC 64411]